MTDSTLKSELPLPSDFLFDKFKSLQRRNDFEDLCESLDDLFEEVIQETYQQAFQHGFDKAYKLYGENKC